MSINYIKSGVLFLMGISLSFFVTGQKVNVETASLSLKTYGKEKERKEIRVHSLEEAKTAIDEAAVNPTTANDPKMWQVRAKTYLAIFNDKLGEEGKASIDDIDAAEKAAISLVNLHKSDEKEKYIGEASTLNIFVNTAVSNRYVGDMAYNKKDYDRAIRYYENTRSLIPYDKESLLKRQNIADDPLVFNIADAEKRSGKTEQAKAHYQELIDRAYNDPWIYLELYDIQLNTEKDTAAAMATIDQGRLVFNENINLKRQQIFIYDVSGKSDELIRIISQDIEDNPYMASNYYLRGLLFRRMKENDKAINDFQKAVENDEANVDANRELGELYYEIGANYTDEANVLPLNQSEKYNELNEKAKKSFENAIPCFERVKDYSQDPKVSGRAAQFLMQLYLKTGQMDKYKELKAEYQ